MPRAFEGNGSWSRPTDGGFGAAPRSRRWRGSGVITSCTRSTFFEFAGSLTVEVEFIVTDQEAQELLSFLRQRKVRLFYAQIPALFGVINPDRSDPAAEERDG
jgi:uncharacterized protein